MEKQNVSKNRGLEVDNDKPEDVEILVDFAKKGEDVLVHKSVVSKLTDYSLRKNYQVNKIIPGLENILIRY